MTLAIGSRTKQANSALSTTNGQIVVFRYAVQAGDVDGAGPGRRGVRLVGRIESSEWIASSLEGERTTQGGSAEHEVALHGSVYW